MIYRRGQSPVGSIFAVYQCETCGFDTEVAGFLKDENVAIKCPECKEKERLLKKIAIGKKIDGHLQLILPIEGALK